MRRIAVITGTRAEYGILKPVLKAIDEHPALELALIAMGMHLLDEFGSTISEIEQDNFKIAAKIGGLYGEDSLKNMAGSVGKGVMELSETLDRIRPDILLLLGDRGEMLAGAVAATYMNIPIAHIHGGEITGNVDEPVRHAITKLAHIHFPATQESADRIIRMGEDRRNVFVVGAPGLDSVLHERSVEPEKLAGKYGLDLSKTLLLVVQHPVTTEIDDAAAQMRATMEAISELKLQTIVVYPNADAGGRRMIEAIREYEKYPFIKSFKSIPHDDYLGLMRIAGVLVGNSSSGIIEAPSLGLPVVNIGIRQQGRQRGKNVIDVGHDKQAIIEAIEKALADKRFLAEVRKCRNPYGDGKASRRIVDVLNKIELNLELIRKKMAY